MSNIVKFFSYVINKYLIFLLTFVYTINYNVFIKERRKIMKEKKWDMYTYILESKQAVRDIVNQQEDIFNTTVDYILNKKIDQIYIIGSGTSYHAAVAAKPIIEKVLGIKVFQSYPIDFKDELIFNKNTLVIGISHAGMSASTIAGLDKARNEGFATIAVTAEKDTPILKHADQQLFIEMPIEYAGPKTKGYICSIVTLVILGLKVALKQNRISQDIYDDYIKRMLKSSDNIPLIAEKAQEWYQNNKQDFLKCRRLYIIGYENCISAMLEGTLKISESVRYSTQCYELEEFMHGIYHCIDQDTYMFYLGSGGQYFNRAIQLKRYFEEERNAHCFLISNENNNIQDFYFPFTNDKDFTVMEYVVPLQVFARSCSADLGIDANIPSDPDFHKKMQSYIYDK